MHYFISLMFSLLVIIGLQVSVQAGEKRPERSTNRHYRSELTVPNGIGWGTWGDRDMCPLGMYAAGFSLKVDTVDGLPGDLTAVNGIRLHCINVLDRSLNLYHNYASVRSEVGSWGRWTEIKWCHSGFLTAFQLRVEKYQGAGDDTAATNIKFKCSQGFLEGDGRGWGDWGDWSQTCEGKGICGIKTNIEKPQEALDDSALDDVRMYCCD
ncbi:vitelline membrane outer layer protein 1-like [Garra rufa]|uniref:vitelline membrane outer layer protein 1-like n=1 Tax=Garra rufa TaxID=137080 RepID=UPI003CCE5752